MNFPSLSLWLSVAMATGLPTALATSTPLMAQANEPSLVVPSRPVPRPVVRSAPVVRPAPRPVVRARPTVRPAAPRPIARPAPVQPRPVVRRPSPKRPQPTIANSKPKTTAPPPRKTAVTPAKPRRVKVVVPKRHSPPPARIVRTKPARVIAMNKQRSIPPARRVKQVAIAKQPIRLTQPPVPQAPKKFLAMAPPVAKGLRPAIAPIFAPTPHQQAQGFLKRLLPNPGRMLFPLTMPARISSAFGWRKHPISGEQKFHGGTDIAAPMGTPVVAVYSGQVAIADYLGGYGLQVLLHHDGGQRATRYAHLSEIFVQSGQVVKQGTVVGLVGSTGYSTGPHLHFELLQKTYQGYELVDPSVAVKLALSTMVDAQRMTQTPPPQMAVPPAQPMVAVLGERINASRVVGGKASLSSLLAGL